MKLPKRNDELGDSFPNDWLELVVVISAVLCISAGMLFLYFLGSQT